MGNAKSKKQSENEVEVNSKQNKTKSKKQSENAPPQPVNVVPAPPKLVRGYTLEQLKNDKLQALERSNAKAQVVRAGTLPVQVGGSEDESSASVVRSPAQSSASNPQSLNHSQTQPLPTSGPRSRLSVESNIPQPKDAPCNPFKEKPKDSPQRLACELRMTGMLMMKPKVPNRWLQDMRDECFAKVDEAVKNKEKTEQGTYDVSLYKTQTETSPGLNEDAVKGLSAKREGSSEERKPSKDSTCSDEVATTSAAASKDSTRRKASKSSSRGSILGKIDALAAGLSIRDMWEPILLALGESQNAVITNAVKQDEIKKDNFNLWSSGILSTDEGSFKNPWPKRPPQVTAVEAALYCALLAGRDAPFTLINCLHVFVPLVDWEASVGMSNIKMPAGSILIVDDKKSPKKNSTKSREQALGGKPVLYFTYCRRSPKEIEAVPEPVLECPRDPLLVPEKITRVTQSLRRADSTRTTTSVPHADGKVEQENAGSPTKRILLSPSMKKLCYGSATKVKCETSGAAPLSHRAERTSKMISAEMEPWSSAEPPRISGATLSETRPLSASVTDVEDAFMAATAAGSPGGMHLAPRVLANSRVLPSTRLQNASGKALRQFEKSKDKSSNLVPRATDHTL